jgi:DNA-binding NarL/FixJ family response regulator
VIPRFRADDAAAGFDGSIHVPIDPDRSATPNADRAAETSDPSREDSLTKRETEVLEMVAEGAGNAEIADRLGITPGTVKSHVSNILHRLGARNRAQAVAQYLRR